MYSYMLKHCIHSKIEVTDCFFGLKDPCSSERLTLVFPKRSGSSSAMSTKAPDSTLDMSFWDTGRNASPTGTGGEMLCAATG